MHYSFQPLNTLEKELSLLTKNSTYFSSFYGSQKLAHILSIIIDDYKEHKPYTFTDVWGIVVVIKDGTVVPFHLWLAQKNTKKQCEIIIKKEAFLTLTKLDNEVEFPSLSLFRYEFNYPPMIILYE